MHELVSSFAAQKFAVFEANFFLEYCIQYKAPKLCQLQSLKRLCKFLKLIRF